MGRVCVCRFCASWSLVRQFPGRPIEGGVRSFSPPGVYADLFSAEGGSNTFFVFCFSSYCIIFCNHHRLVQSRPQFLLSPLSLSAAVSLSCNQPFETRLAPCPYDGVHFLFFVLFSFVCLVVLVARCERSGRDALRKGQKSAKRFPLCINSSRRRLFLSFFLGNLDPLTRTYTRAAVVAAFIVAHVWLSLPLPFSFSLDRSVACLACCQIVRRLPCVPGLLLCVRCSWLLDLLIRYSTVQYSAI